MLKDIRYGKVILLVLSFICLGYFTYILVERPAEKSWANDAQAVLKNMPPSSPDHAHISSSLKDGRLSIWEASGIGCDRDFLCTASTFMIAYPMPIFTDLLITEKLSALKYKQESHSD